MSHETIILDRHEHVAILTLNRPERYNAINATLRGEVTAAMAELRDDDDVRVVMLTGAGKGFCSGAGMSTALAADLRVGSENSRFKTVFIERSLSPDSGMSYFLPRIVGYARAADLIFTSRAVDAQEAYRLGLLDRLVPHANLIEESVKVANEMTQWPPLALRVSKRVLQHNFEADIDEAMKYETVGLGQARAGKNDAKEAMLAFTEKRKPKYTGT